jgi:predicted Zn-dependent protease
MRYRDASFALLLMVSSSAAWADQPSIESADQLFQAGKFAEAAAQYATLAAQNPDDYHAALQLGQIALLGNQFDAAEMWLQKANGLRPDAADAKVMLAEVYYRQDEFDKAAAALNGIETSTNQLLQVPVRYPERGKVAKLRGPDAVSGARRWVG